MISLRIPAPEAAIRPTFCWWVIATTVAAFATVGVAAGAMTPPVVAMAEENFTLAAILAVSGVIVFAFTNLRPFGRHAQMSTFIALMAIGLSWYGAREWVRGRDLSYLAARQREQLRLASVQLSGNILRFLQERRLEVPPAPRPRTWDEDERAITRFENQTVRLFEQKFAREVRSFHDQLALRGLRDRDLDVVFRRPADEFQIRTIAVKLAWLANRLQR